MDKMLLITPECPYPPDGGGPIRLLNLIRIYQKYFDITLLFYYFDDSGLEDRKRALLEWCKEVAAVRMQDTKFIKIRSALMALTVGIPFNSCKFIQKEFCGKLKALLLNGSYKYIILEHSYMLPYTMMLRSYLHEGSKMILDAHNFETSLCRDRIKTRKGINKLKAKYTYICMKKMEKKHAGMFDMVFATSEMDMDFFRSTGTVNVHMVPNVISGSECIPIARDNKNLLFCGTLSYFPNREGIEFFYENMYKSLKAQVEGIGLYVVGKEPDAYICSISENDDSVILTGYVDDVSKYYRNSALLVVPLLSGSGTRLKILDAFVNGTVVISTTKGCEGLEVRHLRDIYIADSPEDFIKGIINLLKDRELREHLRNNAFNLVNKKYSINAIENQITELLGCN